MKLQLCEFNRDRHPGLRRRAGKSGAAITDELRLVFEDRIVGRGPRLVCGAFLRSGSSRDVSSDPQRRGPDRRPARRDPRPIPATRGAWRACPRELAGRGLVYGLVLYIGSPRPAVARSVTRRAASLPIQQRKRREPAPPAQGGRMIMPEKSPTFRA